MRAYESNRWARAVQSVDIGGPSQVVAYCKADYENTKSEEYKRIGIICKVLQTELRQTVVREWVFMLEAKY